MYSLKNSGITMGTETWKSMVRFFRNERSSTTQSDLSDPIAVRIPVALLEEVTAQSKAIGGDRYRSKHLINLIELGTKFYRVNSEYVSQLPIEHLNLITRLHYVFNELDLEVAKVAHTLGHENALKVSNWLNGVEIPSFTDLDQLSVVYFLDSTWLKFGSSSQYLPEFKPFIVIRESFHGWQNALKQILQDFNGLQVRSIRIIRSDTGSVAVSIGYGKEKDDWHVRTFYYSNLRLDKLSDVGNSGFAYLVELAILCSVFYNHIREPLIISYNIPENEFQKIVQGEQLPIHLRIWGQEKACYWYESIFDSSDTKNNSDSSYWPGAVQLFKEIQSSSNFIKRMDKLKENPAEQISHVLTSKDWA